MLEAFLWYIGLAMVIEVPIAAAAYYAAWRENHRLLLWARVGNSLVVVIAALWFFQVFKDLVVVLVVALVLMTIHYAIGEGGGDSRLDCERWEEGPKYFR